MWYEFLNIFPNPYSSTGQVNVIELRIEKRLKPDKLRSTSDHKGCHITSMKWNSLGTRLFVGDDFGKVSMAKISSHLVKVDYELFWIS